MVRSIVQLRQQIRKFHMADLLKLTSNQLLKFYEKSRLTTSHLFRLLHEYSSQLSFVSFSAVNQLSASYARKKVVWTHLQVMTWLMLYWISGSARYNVISNFSCSVQEADLPSSIRQHKKIWDTSLLVSKDLKLTMYGL